MPNDDAPVPSSSVIDPALGEMIAARPGYRWVFNMDGAARQEPAPGLAALCRRLLTRWKGRPG